MSYITIMPYQTIELPTLELEFVSRKEHSFKGLMCYFKILNYETLLEAFCPSESYNPIWRTDKGDYLIGHHNKNYENLILTKGQRYLGKYRMVSYPAKGVQGTAFNAELLDFREVANEEKEESSQDPFAD
jgi:hypothetical protein